MLSLAVVLYAGGGVSAEGAEVSSVIALSGCVFLDNVATVGES